MCSSSILGIVGGTGVTFQECIERCHPSDPRQPTLDLHFKRAHPYQYPRYHPPECDSFPDKQEEPLKAVFRPRPIDKELDHVKSDLLHLQGKLNEQLDKSKKVDKQTKYTIST